ncbi:uncharacterized protein LOC110983231 [Acanthaster planci]|uniref:Uncharacterized protein LOC110983231 n=1 Tax=Acanthaster planci TaxID=133434 RepID=A0A8B7YZ90_ACAPL|nr:uncharacterized protein LOC110983231 [Acanthaster planci]XP_022098007.1 uncharacterized protein LOC110983231 [Acanthaster planci]XP_022098008.1 uncharacterized protein LOC110983231 [Acanthaster planci]XP_022098009.1 uncharacterized protein LOC110983231 [Acanthaster planci]XP_022098010.1 uncharacterized protein LOC110983231 [Acanthaster planci]XP_022098011.1 uncharacterized protein LOC110983231 [Acanthaster planci]XP_022098012.1 uncharacterized protein LOC110983231 [Acanthaster planci]XP_0
MKFGSLRAALAMLIISSFATIAVPGDVYPNPQKDLYRCGRRGRASWICDPDQVLSFHAAEDVNTALSNLRVETECSCHNAALCSNHTGHGYSVAVAVMSFLPTTRRQLITATSYAKYLREHEWLYGNCEDDVVIVVSKLEKQVAASVGDTAARKLTARVMADIFSDTSDNFQNGNFSEGLLEIIERMRAAFRNDYVITPSFPVWTVVQMAMATLFVLICFFSMYICRKLYS